MPSYCVISDLLLIFYYSPVPSSIIQADIAAVISIFSLPFLALPGISLADSWGAFILSLCHDRVQWDLLKLIPWLYLLPVTIRNLFPLKRIEQIRFRPAESMHKHREAQEDVTGGPASQTTSQLGPHHGCKILLKKKKKCIFSLNSVPESHNYRSILMSSTE